MPGRGTYEASVSLLWLHGRRRDSLKFIPIYCDCISSAPSELYTPSSSSSSSAAFSCKRLQASWSDCQPADLNVTPGRSNRFIDSIRLCAVGMRGTQLDCICDLLLSSEWHNSCLEEPVSISRQRSSSKILKLATRQSQSSTLTLLMKCLLLYTVNAMPGDQWQRIGVAVHNDGYDSRTVSLRKCAAIELALIKRKNFNFSDDEICGMTPLLFVLWMLWMFN